MYLHISTNFKQFRFTIRFVKTFDKEGQLLIKELQICRIFVIFLNTFRDPNILFPKINFTPKLLLLTSQFLLQTRWIFWNQQQNYVMEVEQWHPYQPLDQFSTKKGKIVANLENSKCVRFFCFMFIYFFISITFISIIRVRFPKN